MIAGTLEVTAQNVLNWRYHDQAYEEELLVFTKIYRCTSQEPIVMSTKEVIIFVSYG
jgi:hypothetical protein